jgi:hypothetical protein
MIVPDTCYQWGTTNRIPLEIPSSRISAGHDRGFTSGRSSGLWEETKGANYRVCRPAGVMI